MEPRQWGNFTLLERIGDGSSAVVYRARRGSDGPEVALKVARATLPADALARFLREGQVAALFRHPAALAVQSTGEVGGVPFVAFDYAPGARPLGAVWEAWPRGQRVDAVKAVAEAMAAAHAAGLVHRDLKPANVLVDAHGAVQVADFGMSWHQELETLTQSQALLGTPLYMAPEVWSAPDKAARRNPAVDVWSLGVMLYEALTGTHPYGAGDGTLLGVLDRLQVPIKPPRAIAPDVAPALEAICLRALARLPRGRFNDAGELLAAFAAPPRRGPGWRAFAFAIAAIAILAGAWAQTWPGGASPPEPAAGRPPPTSLEGVAAIATPSEAASSSGDVPEVAGEAAAPGDEPSSVDAARDALAEDWGVVVPPSSGTLQSDPNPVPVAPGELGTATLSWQTAGRREGGLPSVWVRAEGAREFSLFSRGSKAREVAPWIQPGQRYVFRLFAGPEPSSKLLDEVVVVGEEVR